jgi:hypothetical protein
MKIYLSAVSTESSSRQKRKKIANASTDIVYLRQKTKTTGSGRKVKYHAEELFIIEMIVYRWESGYPIDKGEAYDRLISRVDHSGITP